MKRRMWQWVQRERLTPVDRSALTRKRREGEVRRWRRQMDRDNQRWMR